MKVNSNMGNQHRSLETKEVDANLVKLSSINENAMELYEGIEDPWKSTKAELVSATLAQASVLYFSIAA